MAEFRLPANSRITGKGKVGHGVLKQRTPEWLAGPAVREMIAGVSTADQRHGGDGAGDRLVDIERLLGSAHDDVLGGGTAADLIVGGAGDASEEAALIVGGAAQGAKPPAELAADGGRPDFGHTLFGACTEGGSEQF